MKLIDAIAIIGGIEKPKRYRVSYDRRKNGFLYSEYFPDHTEPPIASREEAEDLASKFSAACGSGYCNVKLIYADSFSPASGNYKDAESKPSVRPWKELPTIGPDDVFRIRTPRNTGDNFEGVTVNYRDQIVRFGNKNYNTEDLAAKCEWVRHGYGGTMFVPCGDVT
jgi:hypothetical protein